MRAGWMLAALCLPGAAHAGEKRPDRAELPPLESTSAHAAQGLWTAVKALGGIGRQLDAISKKRLVTKVCTDLVDLRMLADGGALTGFAFRDNVRGRSWARPTLALVLAEAMRRFQREYPGRVVAIGDVSQPGCGQVEHGVLIQEVRGEAAKRLIDLAHLELSARVLTEVRRASYFPWESDRFGLPEERVLVTTRLLGKTLAGEELSLRVARTRHRELAAPAPEERIALADELGRLMRGTRVVQRKVQSVDAAGVSTALWLSHWVSEPAGRQVVLVTRNRPRRRLDWGNVVEVRLASWQDKKPGSFPDEVRWVVQQVTPEPSIGLEQAAPPLPIAAVTFQRWALLYEAGHISHLSGIDADLSYVTLGDARPFAVDLEALDVPATWRWLEIVVATARELGTPVDAILVDPKIKRRLEQGLPPTGPGSLTRAKKGPAWRLLKLAAGHDAHHHLRLVEATAAAERAARKRLLRSAE